MNPLHAIVVYRYIHYRTLSRTCNTCARALLVIEVLQGDRLYYRVYNFDNYIMVSQYHSFLNV